MINNTATKGIGVQPLLDLLVKEFPSPAEAATVEGTDPRTKQAVTRAADPKAPLTAVVFKTIADPHVGKLSLFRVYSGTFKADSQVFNATRGTRERIGHVGWLQGKTQKQVESLGPGEIGVVAKLKDTLTGDTLSDEAQLFGSEAAARRYFGTNAASLTPVQAARLAAMAPNPRHYEKNPGSKALARKTAIILARMPAAELP